MQMSNNLLVVKLIKSVDGIGIVKGDLMNQVHILEVKFEFGDTLNTIYPVILKDDKEMILVDCGYPGFLELIKTAADEKGLNLADLTKIIITHHDYDHMGALNELKAEFPYLKVVSSEIEEKYISGKEKSLRLQQAEAMYDSLPEEQKPGAENFHNLLRSIKPVNVDLTVKDHDEFGWCGGVEVISTPGHMPGHISLYLKDSKILISGDALVVENGELGLANPNYTLDIDNARRSVKKLSGYEIDNIICYHGGLFKNEIKPSLKKVFSSAD